MTLWVTNVGNVDNDDDGVDNSETEQVSTKCAFGSKHECINISVPHLLL